MLVLYMRGNPHDIVVTKETSLTYGGRIMNWIKNLSLKGKIIFGIVGVLLIYVGILYASFIHHVNETEKREKKYNSRINSVWNQDGLESYMYNVDYLRLRRKKSEANIVFKAGLFDLKEYKVPVEKYCRDGKKVIDIYDSGKYAFYCYSLEDVTDMPVGVIVRDNTGIVKYKGVANINDRTKRAELLVGKGEKLNIYTYYLADEETLIRYQKDAETQYEMDNAAFDEDNDEEFIMLTGIKIIEKNNREN